MFNPHSDSRGRSIYAITWSGGYSIIPILCRSKLKIVNCRGNGSFKDTWKSAEAVGVTVLYVIPDNMASGLCELIKFPQNSHSAYSCHRWHDAMCCPRGWWMLVYRKKKIRSSAFPSFPHTFTGAHSQVCGFPLCLCWLALGLTVLAQASCSQGFLRMDSSSVENGWSLQQGLTGWIYAN